MSDDDNERTAHARALEMMKAAADGKATSSPAQVAHKGSLTAVGRRLWKVDEILKLMDGCMTRGIQNFEGEGLKFSFARGAIDPRNRRHDDGGP